MMQINSSRRNFLRGLGGAGLFAIGGCKCPFGRQKVKLAAVGVLGKGYSDWTPMLKSGLVEMVAFCDADYTVREQAAKRLARDGIDFDMYSVPFYTDYRKLLDDAGVLGIEAMTISTPDHVHAPVAIGAMKQGIHVYVQKPLVRTLWELDYFNRTAKDNGVIVQMGNQGSSLDSMRRCTEVIQSGILGDVKEVHVWTNRAVWPQGKGVADYVTSRGAKGDPVRAGLNWDAWLATAKKRPFLDKYPAGAKVYDPWKLGANVYHSFTWRGFHDFGAGAFGDMACHTMNLPFRGLELAGVSDAECVKIEEKNDIAYPSKSIVKLTYKARESKVRPGVKLPAVTLFWYDGYDESKPGKSAMKPNAEIMPKVIKTFGEIPNADGGHPRRLHRAAGSGPARLGFGDAELRQRRRERARQALHPHGMGVLRNNRIFESSNVELPMVQPCSPARGAIWYNMRKMKFSQSANPDSYGHRLP